MKQKRIVKLAVLLILALISLMLIIPFVWMVLNSFKTQVEIVRDRTFLPNVWTFENYRKVWDTVPILNWFVNSVLVTVTATAIIVFTSTLLGFIFAKFRFKGRTVLFWLILATMMVPIQATMIPSFLIITNLGMYDKLSALVVPGMISGFGIFLSRQFIEDVPDSLCEAAVIDGAGPLFIYSRIIIPLIRPAIGALVIFTFLQYWNDYLNPLLYISEPKNMTMSLAISFFSSQRSSNPGAIMAAATMAMLPVAIVFLAFQKQFIKGIAMTGMK